MGGTHSFLAMSEKGNPRWGWQALLGQQMRIRKTEEDEALGVRKNIIAINGVVDERTIEGGQQDRRPSGLAILEISTLATCHIAL